MDRNPIFGFHNSRYIRHNGNIQIPRPCSPDIRVFGFGILLFGFFHN